jgi:predicted dehydrogenase
MTPIRVGLVGAGYIGQRHLRHLSDHPGVEVVGIYDTDPARLQELKEKGYGIFSSYTELIGACEAVFITSPTPTHYAYAAEALRKGKHIFIEKPIVTSPEELEDLLRLADEAGTVTMVGHIERFNPAFQAVMSWASEVHMVHFERLAPFTVRGSEVSVVLDLLIHDLDLVWAMWRRIPSHFQATGSISITKRLDSVQVWLSFSGGHSASFVVSRHSPIRRRRATLVGLRHYFEVDLLNREAHGWELLPEATPLTLPTPSYMDAMQEEIAQFLHAIQRGAPSPIPIEDVQPVMEWAWHLERLAWRALGVSSPSERL